MTGTSLANVSMPKTTNAFLRYVLLPLGCGVRRKFSESVVNNNEKIETLLSIFQGSARLKGCIEEAFERTMQCLVIGLKSPWLMMETGETDYTEAFREKVTIPFNQQEGLNGQLTLLFLDTFFIDFDTVADEIPKLLGHEDMDDERFLSLLLTYEGSENVDDLAEAAWAELHHSLTAGIGLEEEHPVVRLGAFHRLLMDGVLTHVHEIIYENSAWSSLVDYLAEENIDRDRIRAITTKDPDLSQRLTQEQLILDRVKDYRSRMGDIFENRGWLFDIADRLDDDSEDFECELTGQMVSSSKIRIFVDKALEKVHERQGTTTVMQSAAALERPSKSALELLKKAREDFTYADWRDDKYAKTLITLAAAVWPVAGPLMAERYLRESLAFDPDDPLCHYNLYLLELHKERYDRALQHLEKAVEKDPETYEPFDLSRFTIDRILGAGGAGVTFEVTAWDDRQMVVKSLWDDLNIVDPRPALRSLQHIVKEPLEGAETVNYLLCHRKSKTYVVSEYIYGEDLETFRKARGGRIPIIQVLEIGFRMAAVMASAHERGLIHRNIKPENVRVGAGMSGLEINLTDFAVPNYVISIPERVQAVRRFACWSRLGRKISEAVAGYVAPEMLNGGPEAATEKSDLFALGATLYRLVTGNAPREFDVNDLPRELRTVVSKCLHKDPDQRPPSAKALARAFKKIAALVKSGVTAGTSGTDEIPDIDDQLPDMDMLDDLPDFGPPKSGLPGQPLNPMHGTETLHIPAGEDDTQRFGVAFSENQIAGNFGPPLTSMSNADTIPIGPGTLDGLSIPGPGEFGAQDQTLGMPAPGELNFGAIPQGNDPFAMPSSLDMPVALGGPMILGPGGALPNADPFNMNAPAAGTDPFALSPDLGVPNLNAPAESFGLVSGGGPGGPLGMPGNPLGNFGGPPANDLGTSDPFGVSESGDPFGMVAPPGSGDPFGLVSQAPGSDLPGGGVTDTLQALANTPANVGGADPFSLSGDPFGLGSGVNPGAGAPQPGADPFGLMSGVNNSTPANPFGASPDQPNLGADPFGMSNDGGMLTPPPGGDPLAQFADSPSADMEESAEEEPLDPMEALRMLEAMTGGPSPPVSLKPAQAQLSAPVDLSSFGVGLDDPFGLGGDPLGGGLGDDPFGADSMAGDPLAGFGDPMSAGPSVGNDPFGGDLDLAVPDFAMPESMSLGGGLDDLALPPDLGGDMGGGLSLPPDLSGDMGLGGGDLGDLGGLNLDPPGSLAPPPGLELNDMDSLASPPLQKAKSGPAKKKDRKGVDEANGYGIVISGLGLKSKKEVAIKIIMEVRNISEDEARDLCRSPVVPVLKRVSKELAESAMTRFKAAKINCRLNKRRGRRR
jgi:serine/threonine protein kinase